MECTDKSSLETHSTTLSQFIEILLTSTNKLTAHSYISRAQTSHYIKLFLMINNRRMPNCTTVVQTANYLFQPKIGLNSPKKRHFSALDSTNKPSKILRHCTLINKFVLLDFAENYSFVIEDEVQGFHWNNIQATVHPIVIYNRENG